MKRLSILGLLAVLLVSSQLAWGSVPQLINFQGVLKSGGQPVSNGSHSMTFAIYDVLSGGSPLWTETQSVITTGGHFAVLLGTVTPIPNGVFNAADRYLGITVPPDPELSPRQRLASVSFSYRVGTVDGASGGTIDGSVHLASDNDESFAMSRANGTYAFEIHRDATTGDDILRTPLADNTTWHNYIKVGEGRPSHATSLLYLQPEGGVVEVGGMVVVDGGGLNVNGGPLNVNGGQNLNVGGTAYFTYANFANTIYPNGTVYGGNDMWAYHFFIYSDERCKTEVAPLTDVLTRVERLRGVTFNWNDEPATGKQIGVIAQEVEREFPELVGTRADGYKAVDYAKLSAVLLEAIKEQQKEIEALKVSVEKMRAEEQ